MGAERVVNLFSEEKATSRKGPLGRVGSEVEQAAQYENLSFLEGCKSLVGATSFPNQLLLLGRTAQARGRYKQRTRLLRLDSALGK